MVINEQATIKNEHQPTNEEKLLVVSVGAHTRLGDVLEFALANTAFESMDTEAFLRGGYQNRRVLFAVSAVASGENAELRALAANLTTGMLEGCVCAAIADGAAGGEVHLDLIRLLRAANDAGATVIAKPLLESGRELRQFAVGKETPFAKYQLLARELVARLTAQETITKANPLVRFLTALEGGAAHDWREYLSRLIDSRGGELADIGEQDETILLCENTDGIPDERTLARLTGSGKLRILLASPATGSELYAACLFERACLRGSYTLPPRALTVFEGLSAVEVMASKVEMERVSRIVS
ncbi:MAG TPA: hypothetical protein VN538_12815 [Clostridia bacterium]|nr:hypothetical protein [Clostridia bacterium]